jgi:ATP adenylyltransferase
MKYIQSSKHETCFFCEAILQPDSEENLVVYRGQSVFAILNQYPYTSGHLMIVPFQHVRHLEKLDSIVRAEMMEISTQATQVLTNVYHPEGFNLGINIGEIAGAGVADHIHLHVVARWSGDTNFMSAIAETRVLPEALAVTYQRIRVAWKQL